MVMRALFVLIWIGLAGAPAAQPFAGTIRVIDGDTLDVGGARVRIFGIDAPETGQSCGQWQCGKWAKQQVTDMYQDRRAICTPVARDKYQRIVARCQVGGQDIAAVLVEGGIATAYRRYSLDYLFEEKSAMAARRGIWRGEFLSPEKFRALRASVQASDCEIKGNISSRGKIYHVPGQEYYRATRISAAKGERYFCSEAAARKAGWRKAHR